MGIASRYPHTWTYTYVYTDGLLTRMTKGDIMLYFTYDAAGMPLTVSLHKGTNCKVKKGEACGTDCKTYYYVTNLQGDVIAILDETGDEVAEYSYDAWGDLLCAIDEDEETIYSLNPLLYRGYVYDRETSLYYLQSRYYNPEIGRFISADNVMSDVGGDILGNNLFAYCLNNPVNRTDPNGNWSGWATAGIIVGVVLCVAAVSVLTFGVGAAAGTLAGAVAIGAAKGALIGAAAGTAVGAGIGYAATGTLDGAIEGAAIGFGAGAVIGAIVGGCSGANSFYNEMAREFTRSGSKEVILGRSGTYEPIAQSRGSTYFHTSPARWNEVQQMAGMGKRGMWKINKAFLDQQINAGSTFYLANNPATAGGYYFQKEVAYLMSKGVAMIPLY